jgi:glycosyltransferase involved in cell wall biosynthesis
LKQKVRLLYIDYWGVRDPLTISTVFPNLEILRTYCSEIYLTTVERKGRVAGGVPHGIRHVPFYTVRWLPRTLQKLYDVVFFSLQLLWLARSKKIDLVICRGALAAIFGLVLHRFSKLPFFVESFEPHSQYMVEGGTWTRGSVEFKFQSWIEHETPKRATWVMPVTNNYRKVLIDLGTQERKVIVMPCCVDLEKFKFDSFSRDAIRNTLNVSSTTKIGIYVGKFGDIYLADDAFEIFKHSFDFFSRRFFLIILSPHNKDYITANLQRVGIPLDQSFVGCVPHDQVPDYLSAADFAFSLVRPSPARKFCSPVKNGEYWANGLPILMPEGVGDDDSIIREENGGACYDANVESLLNALERIKSMLIEGRSVQALRIAELARRHRNFKIISNSYQVVFTNSGSAE